MNLHQAFERLRDGEATEVTLQVFGGSMHPLIKNGATVTIGALTLDTELGRGTIVLCRVRGRVVLHKITGTDYTRNHHKQLYQIANNQGKVNGWTSRENIAGVLVTQR